MSIALITGAKGFIGRHLAQHLTGQKIKVVGLGHGAWIEDDFAKCGLSYWLNGDISQSNLDKLADDVGLPDKIFHLAGGSSVGLSIQIPEEDFQRSVDSSIRLLEWSRHNVPNVQLVLPSSAAVYGNSYSRPICETDTIMPYSPYGYHKRMSELLFESYAENFGLCTSIVRLFSVYGPGLHKQLLWDLCSMLYKYPNDIKLGGNGSEKRDWIHVTDAVNIITEAANYTSIKCFLVNGGTGVAISVREISEFVNGLWGNKTKLQFSNISRPGDPQYLVANIESIQSKGLLSKVKWQQGVQEYVSWFNNMNKEK